MTDALADELDMLSESDRLVILDGLAARLERTAKGKPKHWEHHLLIEAACIRAILSALREREHQEEQS